MSNFYLFYYFFYSTSTVLVLEYHGTNAEAQKAEKTSKAPRGGGKLNGFHDLTASLRSAEGASLRSPESPRFARRKVLASLGGGSPRAAGAGVASGRAAGRGGG